MSWTILPLEKLPIANFPILLHPFYDFIPMSSEHKHFIVHEVKTNDLFSKTNLADYLQQEISNLDKATRWTTSLTSKSAPSQPLYRTGCIKSLSNPF
jgi:hypothetical protein